MYICPTCGKEYTAEENLVKHMSKCWREKNPHLRSKPAPRSEDIMLKLSLKCMIKLGINKNLIF